MQQSINFPSTKSKLLLSIKVSCARYFKLVVKDTIPRVLKFQISHFFRLHYIISTQTTYFNKKLRTLRRFANPESDFRFVQFFLYTMYYKYSGSKISRLKLIGCLNYPVLAFRPVSNDSIGLRCYTDVLFWMYTGIKSNTQTLHATYTYGDDH